MSNKLSRHACADESVIAFMKENKFHVKYCKYCKLVYYPHKSATKETWKKQKYCSSICDANDNLKPFKKTLT